jgi:PAS domain S-box-containing protein
MPAIIDELPDIVLRYDRDGRIVYANEAIRRVTGLPPEHYVGRLAAEVSPTPELAAQFMEARQMVFTTGEPVSLSVQWPTAVGQRASSTGSSPSGGPTGRS